MSRIWGIRHVRYAYLKARLYFWLGGYRELGGQYNTGDEERLDAVWRGER